MLLFLLLLSAVAALCAEQAPVGLSSTLVTALSDDPDYSSLIHLLQRARLIPTLNRLNGSTFFAPTNDAIKKSVWADADNINEQLRQQLFYHLINYSITLPPSEVQVLKTLHYPRNDPPPKDPPPNPWFPVPGGLLGGEPQRLRLTSRDDSAWVGVDASGKGGAQIVKGVVDAGNGILLGIADVLVPPPDLATVVSQHRSTSYFNKVLTPEITELLKTTPELTLFLPVDDAWEALNPMERLYLESEYATDDLYRIINMHAVVEKSVRWHDSFGEAVNLTTIDGTKLEIVVSPEKTMVSTASLIKPDVYASNGVLHLVSSLLVPEGALEITPEKYLLALKCAKFVSLLHSTNLTHLINDTGTKYTILAPSDDILTVFGEPELPGPGSEELREMLQYHFLPGRWTPKKLQDGMLLDTALAPPGLNGSRQVLAVEVSAEAETTEDPTVKSITFGGANIIGEHSMYPFTRGLLR